MTLVLFFEIPYGDRLAKNVKRQYVQVILRSTPELKSRIWKSQNRFSFLDTCWFEFLTSALLRTPKEMYIILRHTVQSRVSNWKKSTDFWHMFSIVIPEGNNLLFKVKKLFQFERGNFEKFNFFYFLLCKSSFRLNLDQVPLLSDAPHYSRGV